jgi:hypothetical protein
MGSVPVSSGVNSNAKHALVGSLSMTVTGLGQIHAMHREEKYTSGFVFEHGSLHEGYGRAVIERSCAAILTLLQDVFAVAEKKAFELAVNQASVNHQNRTFRCLADIIRCRPLIEKSLVTAVTCAYAEILGAEVSDIDNTAEIEKRIVELEKLSCECLDIVSLFHVDDIRDNVTNRNRPLLLDLNAQLALLFGIESKNISGNPLSPATLISGFVAGLMCANMDVRSKEILFQAFEQEFLSRLSVLINSIILRLERENTFVRRTVGFNDKNAGPIERVLADPGILPLSTLHMAINNLHTELSSCRRTDLVENLYELSGEDSLDSAIQLVSDTRYCYNSNEAALYRVDINATETAALVELRKIIERQLNETLSGKKIPVVIKVFLETLWADVLFDVYVAGDQANTLWEKAIQVQQILIESVTPVDNAEKLAALKQSIPGLIKSLRQLLDETGCRFEDAGDFLGELRSLHLQNVQQKLNADAFVLWTDISLSALAPSKAQILDDDEAYSYEQMHKMILELTCH